MEEKIRNALMVSVVTLGFFLLVCMVHLKSDTLYSQGERRKLKQMPSFSAENLLSGRFMEEFETYSQDQFPYRDEFRRLKAITLLQRDNNGLYLYEDSLVSMVYPLDANAISYASKCFYNVYQMYLKEADNPIYLAVIPDKNYFYAKDSGHLMADYEKIVEQMILENPYMSYIDIFPLLSKQDYYGTDPHWRQENITDVAETLLEKMGCNQKAEYETVEAEGEFYGAYYGQAARKVKADKIKYLTNPQIGELEVYDYENEKEIPVYDLSKVEGKDPYELYAGGPVSLVSLKNPNAEEKRKLIVFRDSYGSSIAPLLTVGYGTVILVDIRYIQPVNLQYYIDFENADILFLYSTLVLNNSETLK